MRKEIYDPGTEEDYLMWVRENTTILDSDAYGDPGHGTEDDIPF